MNRRKFLGISTVMGGLSMVDPFESLFSGYANSLLREARAAGQTVEPKSFVGIIMGGGPNRRVWDHFLRAYTGNFNDFGNGMIVTHFGYGDAFNPTYETTEVPGGPLGTLHAPSLWKAQIPKRGGGSAPMTELMQNLLTIQGIRMPSDGHPNNRILTLSPQPGGASINGVLSAASARPLPAVALHTGDDDPVFDAFKSPTGGGLIRVQGGNDDYAENSDSQRVMERIIAPLNRRNRGGADGSADGLPAGSVATDYLTRRAAMRGAMDSALDVMKKVGQRSLAGTGELYDLMRKAETEMKTDLGEIIEDYRNTLQKYSALHRVANQWARERLPGITADRGALNLPGEDRFRRLQNGRLDNNDAGREMIRDNTNCRGLPQGLAAAEVLLRRGKSASVVFSADTIDNLGWTRSGQAYENIGFDFHETALGPDVVACSYYFYVMSTLVYEFIQTIKSAGIWDKTVIQFGSEFARNPRDNGLQSDHGWEGNVITLLSGALKGPTVLGALTRDGGSYPGLWGKAGRQEGVDSPAGHEINIGNYATSLCAILGVTSPTANFVSLVGPDGAPLKSGYKSKIV